MKSIRRELKQPERGGRAFLMKKPLGTITVGISKIPGKSRAAEIVQLGKLREQTKSCKDKEASGP